jgi:hypothetical protein
VLGGSVVVVVMVSVDVGFEIVPMMESEASCRRLLIGARGCGRVLDLRREICSPSRRVLPEMRV